MATIVALHRETKSYVSARRQGYGGRRRWGIFQKLITPHKIVHESPLTLPRQKLQMVGQIGKVILALQTSAIFEQQWKATNCTMLKKIYALFTALIKDRV